MKLSVIFTAALAALAEAKANFTNSAADFAVIQAGNPFTLKWTGGNAPYTITLQNGDPSNLKDVQVIAQGVTGTDFVWTPPGTLQSDIYTFKIVDGTGEPNWSVRWNFQTTGSSSTAGGSSSSSSASSSTNTGSSSTTTGSSSTTTGSSSTTTGSSSTSSRSSTTSGTRTTATTTPTSTPANTNDAMSAKSPLALVLVTIAALLYFN